MNKKKRKSNGNPVEIVFSIHSGLGGKGFNHLSLIKDTSNDNFEFSQDGYNFNKKVAKSPPKRTKTIIRFKPDKQASRSEFDDITDPNVQSHHFTHPVVKHTEARRINNRNEDMKIFRGKSKPRPTANILDNLIKTRVKL